ncbi:MAG: CoA transferase [Deltaproteobacteria bacterium]|nr:CoA transferase [Deltaproteobacteria bacterium]
MDGEELKGFLQEQRKKIANSGLPLRNIRVLDLGSIVAAPYAATILSDFGAEVIKVEPPDNPDGLRFWGVVEGKYPAYWAVASRNKLPVTLNLKHPQGKKIFAQLLERTDVLLENMRPKTLDRLGFPSARLWEIKKPLIIGRISGYGQTGPYALKPGFGTLAEGMSGFAYLNAQPGGPPTNPPLPLADLVAGLHLAIGVLTALQNPRRSAGEGQEIDISLYEPLLSLLGPEMLHYQLTGKMPEPMGNEWMFTAPRNSFQTGDGKWVALSASAQAPFERMMDLISHPELKSKPGFCNNQERTQRESRQVLNQVIGEWIGRKTLQEVLAECEKAGVTIGPIYNLEDILRDPQVRERESLGSVREPLSGKTFSFPVSPIRLWPEEGKTQFPGLPLGAANEFVYQELLGYSAEDLARLKREGAI